MTDVQCKICEKDIPTGEFVLLVDTLTHENQWLVHKKCYEKDSHGWEIIDEVAWGDSPEEAITNAEQFNG